MRILIVEWTRSPWIDVRPRLSAGQLSCLARLARTCAVASVPAAAAAQWHVANVLTALHGGDVSVSAFGDGELPAEHRMQPDGLDPRIFQLFPVWPPARAALEDALAELYSCHNAAVAALQDDHASEIVAVRHELIDSVERCYRESPSRRPRHSRPLSWPARRQRINAGASKRPARKSSRNKPRERGERFRPAATYQLIGYLTPDRGRGASRCERSA